MGGKSKPAKDPHEGEASITLWYPVELVNALDRICDLEDRKRPAVIKRALARYAKIKNYDFFPVVTVNESDPDD